MPVEDRSVLTRPASEPDAVVAYGAGEEQVADVRLGSGNGPVVVVLHGGFWRPQFDRLHLRATTEALAAAGWTSVTPEYHRVPGQPDRMVADVLAAVRAAGERFPGRDLVLAGHSAGRHLALLAAAILEPSHVPVGVLGLAPVADLRLAEARGLGNGAVAAFLGESAEARGDLDPVRLPTPSGAVRIVHGAADDIVPIEVSESYLRAHPAAVLAPVPGGHFAVIDPESGAWASVLGALDELARPGGGSQQ